MTQFLRFYQNDLQSQQQQCRAQQPFPEIVSQAGVEKCILPIVGQVFALLVLTVAAAEAAIGLAILVVYFRNRGSIAVEDINLMKG